MKKLSVVFILILALCSSLQAQENFSAVIKELTGTVEIKKSGSSEWVVAKAGDFIEKSTIISTGFRSMAVISLGDSTLTVRALTRLSLDEIMTMNRIETVNINFNAGRIKVEVNPAAGNKANYSVRTGSSVASVRGTIFEMDTVSIRVLEGRVNFGSTDTATRSVTVNANQESQINAESNAAVNPMVYAEIAAVFPVLRGQRESSEASAKLEFGLLDVNVGVELNK